MNTKKKIAVRKLLSGVLVLLGFTACDSDGPGNELCEYGTPSADYQVKGKVLDQTGKPIKGVQVVVKDLDAVFVKGEKDYVSDYDTVYTDVKGEFEIFRPLFSKERFPKLTYLGIVNSEEQDKIVEMFLESDILPQLETMDVSAGTLKDEGAQLLLDNMDKIAHLKFINMRYNYLSKEMKKQLQSLPMKIDIAETEEADEYDGELWYYPMITE